MTIYYISLFYTLFLIRLFTIVISKRNERWLKLIGAIEYDKKNSAILIGAHFGYYFACMGEGYARGAFFQDGITIAGLGLYLFSIIMLYVVIYQIRHVWTVKLIIAPKTYHKISRGFFFRYFKHPNYYLNILPELVAIGLIFHAWFTFPLGIALYLIPLSKRIREEGKIMVENFENY